MLYEVITVRFVAMAFVPGASDAYIDDEAYYVVFKFDDSDLLNEVEWNREHNRFLGPGQFSDESIAYALSTPLDELDLLAYVITSYSIHYTKLYEFTLHQSNSTELPMR